ncbi:hypothetical protein M422DRAFT_68454 [Sphaerobolus stellatus SS14]|uniref:Calcineurin-like phosphoesterase domain-containing protein n=1 Tax=Sphaerobolus stellatus (strain SS14) TaxID=990650 RepID=A0A0C9VSE7_SPHS4|nr:hypothetical protein M422DRAFT_68454 [Sphaerobolus stellatus SS14]
MHPRRLLCIPSTRSPTALAVAYIRIIWILAILWVELGVFYNKVSTCSWPDSQDHGEHMHMLLIADPQVLDKSSYPGRPGWLMALTQHIVDFNLRKSWRAVKAYTKPDMTIFLGDMMDNGRDVTSDKEYEDYYSKFQSIFKHDPKSAVYYIPGNHDVGLGPSSSALSKSLARGRYFSHFGPLSQGFTLHNTTFLFVDAPGLVDDYNMLKKQDRDKDWKTSGGEATEYLLNFANDVHRPPESLILFTHIPLFRPTLPEDGPESCGTFRQGRRPIYDRIGQGYQNVLPKEISTFILDRLQPDIIFSGDDHDYCDYKHSWHLSSRSALSGVFTPEISVASFSMAMGVRKSGYQLLSIPKATESDRAVDYDNSTVSTPAFHTIPCFLLDQISLYLLYYVPLAVISLAILIWLAVYEAGALNDDLPLYSPKIKFNNTRAKREKRGNPGGHRDGPGKGDSNGLLGKILKDVFHVLGAVLCMYVLVVWWVRLSV